MDGTEPDLRNEAAGVLLSVVEVAIEEGGPMLRKMLPSSGEHRTNEENESERIRQWCVKYVEIVE